MLLKSGKRHRYTVNSSSAQKHFRLALRKISAKYTRETIPKQRATVRVDVPATTSVRVSAFVMVMVAIQYDPAYEITRFEERTANKSNAAN